jgi:hypothetical protein
MIALPPELLPAFPTLLINKRTNQAMMLAAVGYVEDH